MAKRIGTEAEWRENFEAIKPLGEGGYGTVWLCRELSTKKLRAVKTVCDDKIRNRTWCDKREDYLPNEIVLWENLNHPNILSLVSVYFSDELSLWYLVMEYYPGFVDLFSHIEYQEVIDDREAANIIRQLVNAVYYLTLQNIDHRDLKDENILYNPTTQQIKLIDFGSSAELTSEPYRMFRGTDTFIPPEYWEAGCYYPFHASVWAIGCIAYGLLYGDSPFQTRDDVMRFLHLDCWEPASVDRTLRLNFLRDCLNGDCETRILLSDLIHHPWLRSDQCARLRRRQ